MVFKLPCCGHYTHIECFKTWASASQVGSTVRCDHLSIQRHMLPLPARIHRETQLHNMLPHESSLGMHNRPRNSTLTPKLRSLTGMQSAHWL